MWSSSCSDCCWLNDACKLDEELDDVDDDEDEDAALEELLLELARSSSSLMERNSLRLSGNSSPQKTPGALANKEARAITKLVELNAFPAKSNIWAARLIAMLRSLGLSRIPNSRPPEQTTTKRKKQTTSWRNPR